MATLNNFLDEVNDAIKEYTDDVKKELERNLDETGDKILEYVIANTPRSGRKGAMADEFTKTVIGEGITKTIVIHITRIGLIH